MSADSPLNKVRAFFRDRCPVRPGSTLVVAVSGGPDSTCLLHVLNELKDELGIRLQAAHLDHMLRGSESAADAAYVARLAEKLGVPVTMAEKDSDAYRQKHKLSPEEAAREVRYAWLAEAADAAGTDMIAVGHTADDQAETVLMNLLRGTGTRGLRGLLPCVVRREAGKTYNIIRPLLDLTRRDIAAYCRQHKLQPRLDSTNLSTEPFRNRVRMQLLPELKDYNPQIVESLLRTARIAADDIDFIDTEVARLRSSITREEGKSVTIDKAAFARLPEALQRHLLRSVILSLRGTLKDIEAAHVEDVLAALDKPAGRVIGLPDGLNFTIEYDRYVVAPDSAALCPLPELNGEYPLNVPGTTAVPGWEIRAVIQPPGNGQPEDDGFTARMDYGITGAGLVLRARRPGDRFQPLGMKSAKKLNQFMIDERIPRSWRKRVPVVTSAEHIVWVAGWRIDDRARVTPATRDVLLLRFTRT